MRIFKYPLEPERRQIVHMQRNARVISVMEQQSALVMYTEVPELGNRDFNSRWVDPLQKHEDPYEMIPRVFVVLTTGDRFQGNGKAYIGTVTLGGWYVAHVYEQWNGYQDPVDETRKDDLIQLQREMKTYTAEEVLAAGRQTFGEQLAHIEQMGPITVIEENDPTDE